MKKTALCEQKQGAFFVGYGDRKYSGYVVSLLVKEVQIWLKIGEYHSDMK